MAKRWQCLDIGCGAVVSAGSDEELVEAANAHMREAHGSYELEEMILAVAEEAPANGATVPEQATK